MDRPGTNGESLGDSTPVATPTHCQVSLHPAGIWSDPVWPLAQPPCLWALQHCHPPLHAHHVRGDGAASCSAGCASSSCMQLSIQPLLSWVREGYNAVNVSVLPLVLVLQGSLAEKVLCHRKFASLS